MTDSKCALGPVVEPGADEKVNCSLAEDSEVTWYLQRSGHPPQAIVNYAEKSALPATYYNGFHPSKYKPDSEQGVKILIIKNFTNEDSAAFYCASRKGPKVHFAEGATLTATESTNSSVNGPCSCSEGVQEIKEEYDLFFILTVTFVGIIFCMALGFIICKIQAEIHNNKNKRNYKRGGGTSVSQSGKSKQRSEGIYEELQHGNTAVYQNFEMKETMEEKTTRKEKETNGNK
ncbi:uncharacterized protein LOC114669707 isoform X2 [Erpetoichthys calabaricus]|uniref:uncharacterized protein LOC114669707 isoform X2 n=1 Tax=Erpetoichthys calabaricus TaxID=27687 RepID=UPI00223459AC|nr:uncharacterized protein LOC114669707 isoform X2 [Erpetoichthys calabaricus]